MWRPTHELNLRNTANQPLKWITSVASSLFSIPSVYNNRRSIFKQIETHVMNCIHFICKCIFTTYPHIQSLLYGVYSYFVCDIIEAYFDGYVACSHRDSRKWDKLGRVRGHSDVYEWCRGGRAWRTKPFSLVHMYCHLLQQRTSKYTFIWMADAFKVIYLHEVLQNHSCRWQGKWTFAHISWQSEAVSETQRLA